MSSISIASSSKGRRATARRSNPTGPIPTMEPACPTITACRPIRSTRAHAAGTPPSAPVPAALLRAPGAEDFDRRDRLDLLAVATLVEGQERVMGLVRRAAQRV